jgi:hypothetical protein
MVPFFLKAIVVLVVSCRTVGAFMPCGGTIESRFRDRAIQKLCSFSQNRWSDQGIFLGWMEQPGQFTGVHHQISMITKSSQRTIKKERLNPILRPSKAGAIVKGLETRSKGLDVTVNHSRKNQNAMLLTSSSIKDPFPSMLQELGRAKLGSGQIQQILVKASAENIKFRWEFLERIENPVSFCFLAELNH